jgi:protein-S-isoprenylcysteine O-methyltransferase Ste14
MASKDRREKAETGMVPEVANLGIMRPPLLYLSAIALGLLLHFAWPVRLVSRAVSVPLGGTAVLVAVALFLYAVHTFRAAGTPVPGNRPTTTIVHMGPYRCSRNPIYLSFSLLRSASHSGSTVSGSSSPSYQRWR